MIRKFPKSIIFFIISAIVFVFQAFPLTGVFLLFIFSFAWHIALINAGMVGVAIEALKGRVPRWWLVLPVAFYGGYWGYIALEQLELHSLSASFQKANAEVYAGFDPHGHALVFANGERPTALLQHYGLPVAYVENRNNSEGYLSYRMVTRTICDAVRGAPALSSASVSVLNFQDGNDFRDRQPEQRFCILSMPERPSLPLVRISTLTERTSSGVLSVSRTTRTISMPNGQEFQILGGSVRLYNRFPMPIIGCGPFPGGWTCEGGFIYDDLTPIVRDSEGSSADVRTVAVALGLQRVSINDRQGGDDAVVLERIAAVEEATLARQMTILDAMIADPESRMDSLQLNFIMRQPDVLAPRASEMVVGLERAAAIIGSNRPRARENGRKIAELLANLPRETFRGLGPSLLALYAGVDDAHWLYEPGPLLRKLGDLGPDAVPYLMKAARLGRFIDTTVIEGLCRVGAEAHSTAEPLLVERWVNSRDGSAERERRLFLYVAMRRMGILPPPLAEDRGEIQAQLEAEWADVTSETPARVCAVLAEQTARRQEERTGERVSNLE